MRNLLPVLFALLTTTICGQARGQWTWQAFDAPIGMDGRTEPTGISGNNIVGAYIGSSGWEGFLYNGTTWTTLNYPGAIDGETVLTGISGNNIVGVYGDAYGDGRGGFNYIGTSNGFLYNGTTWTTLNYPGASATYPTGISGNNIVGYYADSNGQWHGFLLTTPEPATLSLLALGGLLIARRRRAQGFVPDRTSKETYANAKQVRG